MIRDRLTPQGLSAAAACSGLVGLLGAIPVLPSGLLLALVGLFVLVGPGCLIMSWFAHLPAYALSTTIPLVGLSVCILTVAGLLSAGIYDPAAILIGLSLLTGFGGLVRHTMLRRSIGAHP